MFDRIIILIFFLINFAEANISIKDDIKFIKTQLKLYEIIKRSQDEEKIQNFEAELDKSKLISFSRNKKEIEIKF